MSKPTRSLCTVRGRHSYTTTGKGKFIEECTCAVCGKRYYSPLHWLDMFDGGARVLRTFATRKPYFESLDLKLTGWRKWLGL